ncbi:MAG: hypothetical protein ACRDTE_15515 [Pseudonocardiaceae bacterium]
MNPATAADLLTLIDPYLDEAGHWVSLGSVHAALASSLLHNGRCSSARLHCRLALSRFLQVGDVHAAEHARQLLTQCENELVAG